MASQQAAGTFAGTVVFITGAARGQGREHAVRFAEAGADVIAVDSCEQLDSVAYPMATPEDLAETVALIEKTGRRIVAERCDVRDRDRLTAVVARGVDELGRLDFVLANAGIMPAVGEQGRELMAYTDAVAVLLNGVYFTVDAALPALLRNPDGGAIVLTSSAAGFKSVSTDFDSMTHGAAGYTAAKHGVVGLMRTFAVELGAQNIRVNSVHPTNVNTPLFMNEPTMKLFRPDLENPGPEDMKVIGQLMHTLPIGWVEPEDIANAVLFLASDEARFITGVTLPVDGGSCLK